MKKEDSTLFVKKLVACSQIKGKKLFYNLLRKTFKIGQRLGLHIIPNHYYFPVPDTRTLNNETFLRHNKLLGIDINEKTQLELLALFESNYKEEFNKFPRHKTRVPYQYYSDNGNFRSIDGEVLYSMIRHFKPKLIIEIGSGFSTFCSAQAIIRNKNLDHNYECKLICIEPYPNKVLKKKFPGLTKVIKQKVQNIPTSIFKKLTENDILFIDSSHILNIKSDVYYEFLEIIPKTNKGVLIHIHDIFLPLEYPKKWVLDLLRFYNEQYLLQSFLAFNNNFKVLWASKYMQINHSDKLVNIFESYKRDLLHTNNNLYFQANGLIYPVEWPSSFWIKRIK